MTETQSYSASTPMLDLQDRRVATFQMEQKVRTYEEDGSCTIPAEGKSEIQVLIRNETACRLSFDYTLSIFEGQVGRSVQGSAAIDPGATADQGVLIRNLDVRVDRSQFIVTPTNIQLTSCG